MKVDLIGQKFGRLTVVRPIKYGRAQIDWECRCDCGSVGQWKRKSLVTGNTRSCGCLKRERVATLNKSHGLTGTKFYMVFHGMKNRCTKPSNTHYYLYGAKGISVEWDTFESFRDDMYDSYLAHCERYGQKNTQIERVNSNGNYCLQNCKWATLIEQANNTSRSRFLEFNGQKMTVSQWGRELGIKREVIKDRLRRGWSVADIFTIPAIPHQKIYHAGKHNQAYGD